MISVFRLKFRLKNTVSQVRFKATNKYSKTLNLFDSGKFNLSMKNIYENEKKVREACQNDSIYEWQERTRKDCETYILHDGPPYANGDLHMGHMVNKVLKDICLRHKLLSGYRVEYIPGWDCHGLPIELNALKSQGNKAKGEINSMKTREIAQAFAQKYIDVQMSTFKQFNLLANWNKIYRTFDPSFICNEIDLFYHLYKNELVFRNYMPVYWSFASRTALAEFELEYKADHKSNALYVAFEIKQVNETIKNYLKPNDKLYGIIWTTTSWSLPGNKAIAFNSNMKYNLVRIGENEVYIISQSLTENIIKSIPKFANSNLSEILATFDGTALSTAKYSNPFTGDSLCQFLPSDHVTDKQGTGLVHIAPSFGHDDFKLGMKFNLKTECSIDEIGRYENNDSNLQSLNLSGKKAFDKETYETIKSILGERIVHTHEHIHSYPYDWRTKTPVIIRSSKQWFISTDKLKQKALDILDTIKIFPSNVVNSMSSTVASRPYWCISRQRVWGVPIPCLYNSNSDTVISENFIENLKSLIKKDGNVNFWWSNKYDAELLSKDHSKSQDILDIWFDSGSSFNSVLNGRQADLYCEGVDQFSGWFQASLLLSVALKQQSPYKSLLVHGFVVDEENRKMSKSLGNIIEPMQAIGGFAKKKIPQCGIDVLRFWVAHEFHKTNIPIGGEILNKMFKRVFEIRSVIKFMLANTSDLNLKSENSPLVDYESLLAPEKYILNNLYECLSLCVKNYNEMSFNKILIALENFLLSDVSSVYIKQAKDRLYCEDKEGFLRRSSQTALMHILEKVLVIIAPIMTSLAEDAFMNSPLKALYDSPSIFQSGLDYSNNGKWKNDEIKELFDALKEVRGDFFNAVQSDNAALYEVEICCDEKFIKIFEKHKHSLWLTDFMGCSNVVLKVLDLASSDVKSVKIDSVEYRYKVNQQKAQNKFACARCRKFVNASEDCLCTRCENVFKSL